MLQINRTIVGNGIAMTLPTNIRTADEMASEWSEIQAAQLDASQFRPLYNRYYEAVYRFIWRRIADQSMSADLCSQVFLKAMQSINAYTYKGVPFSAWLFRIAANEVKLYYRIQNTQRTVCIEDSNLHLMGEEMNEPRFEEEHRAALLRSLGELKSEEMELVEMRFFEGRAFKEMASILNISENNAKVKTYRVLEKLKKKLS